ncbi:chemotaxis protein CheA [Polyangium sorediatum]|uniref:histidine kinase n=1 Tax=Polyangium sorediatum TaxID=889274 RepID=A0ABT6NLC1_9BACT|nr:chemotaxis protein CheW [Polyangium sorediatum]MDI1429117.1 chemotaxis protein CheW [Polyangium sorediatum]
MGNAFDASEFLAGFLVEAEEHLSASTTNLLAVETSLRKGENNPRAVRELFRSLHTIKGLSAMVGIEPIVDVAHAMETVLRKADRAAGALSANAVEALLAGLRAIGERVRALSTSAPVAPVPPQLLDALAALEITQDASPATVELVLDAGLSAKLSATEKAQLLQGAESGRRALRVDFVPSPARAAEGTTITSVRERIGAFAEIVKVVPLSIPASDTAPGGLAFALLVLTDATNEALAAAAATQPEHVQVLHTRRIDGADPLAEPEAAEEDVGEGRKRGIVRVEVARLDDALERLSALVITRFRLARAVDALAAQGVNVGELGEIVKGYGRQVRDLRGAIMRARMVPVAELLDRVPLIVRGLSRATKKPVRVVIDAGKAELDKAVADRVFPAIVHLIRNAVDHAIEPPAERRRLGKPEEGLVRVTCFERSTNQLELGISDDGRGIDREAVAHRASRPVPADDAGLLDLITLPGLTTLDHATKTSGRGLGMDIVKRAVVELGGELSLGTTPGAGTTFTLCIPLTITIVDAFSFVCGEQTFVAPVAAIEEVVEVVPEALVRGPSRHTRFGEVRFMERRGEIVPLVNLASVFSLASREEPKALVVRRNGAPLAFGIQRMVGQQEVVIRPLEDPLVKVTGVSGSTDLGDGRPTLVLDLVALSGALSQNRTEVPV